ncbi:MAG TPA: peptidoglycan recognition family protein [Bryobacteraceae bacterium]|jgi:hypothetical protein|nr:peptidoglycan recognition family protein [Bryobacteraceae bacterium]
MSLVAPEKPRVRNAARIERKAEKIADPIQRLKYLRQATAPPPPVRIHWGPLTAFCIVALLLTMRSDAHFRRLPDSRHAANAIRVARQEIPNVWRIELSRDFEVYSNGLRIENQLAVANDPRLYALVSVEDWAVSQTLRSARLQRMPSGPRLPDANKPTGGPYADQGPTVRLRTQPAGILFHTTESDQAPFEATQQRNLHRIGRETLLYVRNKRAYHFVIDRFGRVHRIVVESDAANHAGNSVWADSRWLYLELNQSFLGVAFEASMQTGESPINEAQVHAAKVLTEMLRSKYNIPAENCVTHAQVSVNPDNRRIGWHSDWGKEFPFREVGLPENYEQPLPSLFLAGFEYDSVYINATGPGIWKGLALAELRLRDEAAARHMAVVEYRALLQQRYRDEIAALRHKGADEEN